MYMSKRSNACSILVKLHPARKVQVLAANLIRLFAHRAFKKGHAALQRNLTGQRNFSSDFTNFL